MLNKLFESESESESNSTHIYSNNITYIIGRTSTTDKHIN